jgi:hypothetical protein
VSKTHTDDALDGELQKLAVKTVEEANKDDVPLSVRLDVLKTVGTWRLGRMKIKHRTEDDEGDTVDDFKRELAAAERAGA